MIKRSALLGGLIAGAFLLPVIANAGVVTGVCSKCHTMHNSQNGQDVGPGPNNTLLLGSGCAGCHADPAVENATNGRGTDSIGAPQVDNPDGATGYINNAGYFRTEAQGGVDTHQHNVLDLMPADATMIAAGSTNAPGDTAPLIGLGSGTSPNLTCVACHGSSGGHHGSGGSTYRLLDGTNGTTSAQTDYGAVAAGASVTSGTRHEVAYNATDMNTFCAGCHGLFHGTANQESSTSGVWIRHPTDVSLSVLRGSTTDAPSLQDAPVDFSTSTLDAVVVGSDGTNVDVVMCLSCHVPHGGPYDDLLAFPYDASDNAAGDTTRSDGCETCHNYGSAGM